VNKNVGESHQAGNQQDYSKDEGADGVPIFHKFRVFEEYPNVDCHKDGANQYESKTCASNAAPAIIS